MSLVSNFTGASELHIPLDKSPGYLTLEKASICVLLTLITWRFWRFTISPFLHPERPKEFPYWIPYLIAGSNKTYSGHGRAFFQDSNGLLSRARNHFQNTKDPIALTVFGMTFYVVTQAKHSAEVYRNKDTLSFENFVQVLMRNNGNSEQVIQDMYSDLPAEKSGFPNPHGESLGVLAQKMHAHQLHPGNQLDFLQQQVALRIDYLLTLETLSDKCTTYAASRSSNHIELPLYHWCSDYFIRLGQHVYFGETLDQIDPTLPDVFLVFDELIFKMLYQFPTFLSNDMSKPRAQVIASLKKYFQVPQSKRSNGTAWLINAMEDEMRTLGVDDDNLAVVIFHLYLAINTNTRKSVFWMLTYLLHNPAVLAQFREETEPAFKEGQLVDNVYIQEPTNCPVVDQIWHETLRLSGWAASVRLITEDTVIGGKLMSKGNRVMVPHRLLHFDESIFGENPQAFCPERWQKEGLARSPSWRPFGGGQTMCSGRFLARYSVTTFVATLLQRFDVELVGNPPMPQADEGRPVLGIMSIKEGQDFNIRISPRAISR
ncbi:7-alpha-hydroxycholest-4-en-3-one 12-alpha-hydroxylase [Lachnellula subtilissima]|uniref:7-alpha-hydroxycholest-4-en-3-one 12-alpha-hydroxylase n=1 Tax=Lachnellula subtilissima TaxID=602034 RepID=A0A8H8RRP1_9HELO|nr:7-alpha-hydroxycholest-4-en-3-one 12-alpha-hydroxylase [Lachnellula subtilissima]